MNATQATIDIPDPETAVDASVRTHDGTVDAIAFDLAGTLLEQSYARYGLAHLAHELHTRWGIDRQSTFTTFMPVVRAVSTDHADQRSYSMLDVFCVALDRLNIGSGNKATPHELIDLYDQSWGRSSKLVG